MSELDPMSPQQTIAHYRITGKLGEGGMGAVYRATDTKLNRDVAIKILPDSFAQDPDRLARFTREAQVLASLNHPNIAAIYGVEDRSLVMELVEGATLAGPLPEEQALPVVHQLIDALEYAHEKGIIHRDLKPANIKLTPEGAVKVLDFGLAKVAQASACEPGDPARSPTLTMRATVAGAIMGTAAYMAPEQARGHEVDKRADIWAFGVVVYELLTGRMLFAGPSVSDTLASVLRQDLNLEPVPPRFRRLLRSCLERDPRRRMRDIGDARLLLDDAPAAPAAPSKFSKAPWIAAAAAILVAAILGAGWWRAARQTDRPLIRFSAELSPDAVGGPQMIAILSPDGRRVVFRARSPNGFVLATRLLDQAKATVLSGTEGNSFAFFSPDGQWIGFFAGGKLKKISVQGGTPITLCDSSENYGAAWLTDGTIVFLDGFNLMRVPEAGGTPQRIHTDLTFRRWPQPLPGDDRILLTASPIGTTSFDNAALDVVSLKTLQRKTVLRGGYFGRYLPTGHLLYLHQGTMYGVRFDLSRLETQGAPVPLLEEVKGFPQQGAGHFDFSLTGTLVYESGKPGSAEQPLAWLDSTGVQQRINGVAGISLRLSPDGKRLAFSSNNDLSVYDVERDTTTRITFDPAGINRHPVWTPDGKYLVYAGKGGIWWTRSDGSGQPARILEGDPAPTPWSFAAIDGPRRLRLAFHQNTPDKVRNIWILPLDVSEPDRPAPGKPEVFRATPANEVDPAFSPDGRWLAYTSAESGEPQVYVRPYRPGAAPASGGKWQISNGQGRFPVWARNGKQLFFRNAMGYIMAADYTASGAAFVPGRPREWSSALLYMTGNFQDFDVHPDGKRAVIIALPDFTKGGLVAAHADFLLNFFDDLKRRLP